MIFERENVLNRFSSPGTRFEKGFERLAQLREAAVGHVTLRVVAGRAVETVERCGDFENLPAQLEKVAVHHIGRVTSVEHITKLRADGVVKTSMARTIPRAEHHNTIVPD